MSHKGLRAFTPRTFTMMIIPLRTYSLAIRNPTLEAVYQIVVLGELPPHRKLVQFNKDETPI